MKKKILITGSSRGIGLELTRQFLAQGAQVFGTCRTPETADKLIALQGDFPSTLQILELDVAQEKSVKQAYRELADAIDCLDLLINNAGVKHSDGLLADLTVEGFHETFEVNVLGTMLVSREFLPLLKAANNPTLVNITSQLGSVQEAKNWGYYSYNASKAAANLFTRMLAADPLCKGINVLAVHPGWVRTDLGGQSAPVDVTESAAGILELLGRPNDQLHNKFLTYEGVEHAW